MPVVIKTIPFIPRPKRQAAPSAPPALTLVAATLDLSGGDPLVRLTFDRAIDIASIEPGQISVNAYPETGLMYAGFGVDDMPTPESLVLLIESTGAAPVAPTALLNATGSTGIVAVDDPGAAWAGASNLELPFP